MQVITLPVSELEPLIASCINDVNKGIPLTIAISYHLSSRKPQEPSNVRGARVEPNIARRHLQALNDDDDDVRAIRVPRIQKSGKQQAVKPIRGAVTIKGSWKDAIEELREVVATYTLNSISQEMARISGLRGWTSLPNSIGNWLNDRRPTLTSEATIKRFLAAYRAGTVTLTPITPSRVR